MRRSVICRDRGAVAAVPLRLQLGPPRAIPGRSRAFDLCRDAPLDHRHPPRVVHDKAREHPDPRARFIPSTLEFFSPFESSLSLCRGQPVWTGPTPPACGYGGRHRPPFERAGGVRESGRRGPFGFSMLAAGTATRCRKSVASRPYCERSPTHFHLFAALRSFCGTE
jgi:hypothetical protein